MDLTQSLARLEQLKSFQKELSKMIIEQECFIEKERKSILVKKPIRRRSLKISTTKQSNMKKEAKSALIPLYLETKVTENSKNESVKKDRTKTLSFIEIMDIAIRINELPRTKLGRVVRILRNREKAVQIQDPDNIDVDLLKLKNSTIIELKKYVEQ